LKKAIEHLSDFDYLAYQSQEIGLTNYANVSTCNEVVLELGCRVEGNAKKTGKLALTLLAPTLHDVGWHRHRRAAQLATKGRMLSAPNPAGNAVGVECHYMRFLPDLEILEIRHPER
jgi:hypothetical protein